MSEISLFFVIELFETVDFALIPHVVVLVMIAVLFMVMVLVSDVDLTAVPESPLGFLCRSLLLSCHASQPRRRFLAALSALVPILSGRYISGAVLVEALPSFDSKNTHSLSSP